MNIVFFSTGTEFVKEERKKKYKIDSTPSYSKMPRYCFTAEIIPPNRIAVPHPQYLHNFHNALARFPSEA